MESVSVDSTLCREVGRDFCIRSRCYPVAVKAGCYIFAAEKHDELLLEALQLRLGSEIRLVETDLGAFEYQLKLLANETGDNKTGVFSQLVQSEIAVGDDDSIEELREKSQARPVINLVNDIVEQAIAEGATDIHVEPGDSYVKIRYRKDGMLRDSMELPKWVQSPLVSRLKILAELDIAEKRIPHDGRLKWQSKGETIDMRVSTLPTRLGEKVVLRVLKHAFYVSEMDSLGMPVSVLKEIRRIIHMPQGIFFVTGPTGSGKTSTLYAALREILHKDINISTIEDPVEYRMGGTNQVQVNEKAGLTFASALRSLLRQDPDVILVGEIRDRETAAIAVQAAQTGHLVFSTLHTNNAVSAITRMKDLGVKPFLISSSVLGILAQRLVRKVCPNCCKMEPPSKEEIALLPQLPDLCPSAQGCERCGHTGYEGRTGVFELLLFDNDIREAVIREETEQKIKSLAGLDLLIQDGLDKLRRGITTPSEIIRVALTEG